MGSRTILDRPDTGGAPLPCRLPGLQDGIGVYLHIPFCLSKCPYCDFNTYEGLTPLIPAYVESLRREITLWGKLLGPVKVTSVYYGGGTPSYVPPETIAASLDTVRDRFSVTPDAEITIEANPGDIDAGRSAAWLSAGINRLSIGVQSFDDRLLESLGRRHTAEEAARAVACAGSQGFGNISIDLMFGLPNQSLGQWQSTLESAAGLKTQHLSLYGLQLEPGTPMEADVRLGRTPQPDGDLAADMYLMAADALGSAGLRQYEVSNWARPGKESRHNLAYWTLRPYLGLGPGAHSLLLGRRFANIRSPRGYVRRLENAAMPDRPWKHPADAMQAVGTVANAETMDRRTGISDAMMMGMRLTGGVTNRDFYRRFGVELGAAFAPEIRELAAAGLVVHDSTALRLTQRGMLLGNEVFARFVEASHRAAEVRPERAA